MCNRLEGVKRRVTLSVRDGERGGWGGGCGK